MKTIRKVYLKSAKDASTIAEFGTVNKAYSHAVGLARQRGTLHSLRNLPSIKETLKTEIRAHLDEEFYIEKDFEPLAPIGMIFPPEEEELFKNHHEKVGGTKQKFVETLLQKVLDSEYAPNKRYKESDFFKVQVRVPKKLQLALKKKSMELNISIKDMFLEVLKDENDKE